MLFIKVYYLTKNKIEKTSSSIPFNKINFIEPLGYLEFMFLISNCIGVITDSGGIQEETTFLNIPCLTLRKNTERPETITIGTNKLILELTDLPISMKEIIDGNWKKGNIPELWDGKASERIIETILKIYK